MAHAQDSGGFAHASVGVHELQYVLIGDVAFGVVVEIEGSFAESPAAGEAFETHDWAAEFGGITAGHMTPVLFRRRA